MAKFKLTKSQKKELEIAEETVKQIQLLKRIQCVKMRDKGMSNLVIADILAKSDQTISDWIQLYRRKGLEGLLLWNYKGKVSILTADNLLLLEKRNEDKAFEKASEAKAYIKSEFGIDFHLHWVQKIIKKNFILHTKKQD
ncbi:MAG: helix-turn-helix domain-containing protein [Bacteroidales bacterium]|nr:helix-turn-helix domain-containing protein [Bacteroidales bacterium]